MAKEVREYINRRKRELNALVMAHYYQPPEIQDIADFVGDSLELARQAAHTGADVIVICGVQFMAESAKILNPSKTVLLPEKGAGCPMADMAGADALRQLKAQHPGAVVVSYVNSTAEVKAESDICCTSSNALQVVNSIPAGQEIIFVPDRNLGAYISARTGRNMILWEGCCPVHDALSGEQIAEQKQLHPNALVVVHPECRLEVSAMADAVLSTSGILNYVHSSPQTEFIIGTEEGLLYRLRKNNPGKTFFSARTDFSCRDMKYIDLPLLAQALEKLEHKIEVEDEIRRRAWGALEKMLGLG